MSLDLPAPLAPGETSEFVIEWAFNIVEEDAVNARSGYEHFPDDPRKGGNDIFLLAQWFPRMVVYSDYEGWHNKEFLGRGGDPLDNQVMRQKLIAMNNIETIWGPIKFSSKGRIESAGLPVIQWQGKDPALQVLHPPALKTGNIVYPTPPWSKRG